MGNTDNRDKTVRGVSQWSENSGILFIVYLDYTMEDYYALRYHAKIPIRMTTQRGGDGGAEDLLGKYKNNANNKHNKNKTPW